MTIEEVNNYADVNETDMLLFSNPDFPNAIIGISSDDRVIYDYDLMVQDLMKSEDLSETDAIEFINYNTIRSLPYYEKAPIILEIKHFYK